MKNSISIWFVSLFLIPMTGAFGQDVSSPTVASGSADNLPTYDDIRSKDGNERPMGDRFMIGMPTTTASDVMTSGVVFPKIPVDAKYSRLRLADLVDLALENNFDLTNADRDVIVARSSVRSAEAPFIPYVDVIGESRYRFARDRSAYRIDPVDGDQRGTTRDADTVSNTGGLEAGVSLPTGGRIVTQGTQTRTDSNITDGSGTLDDSRNYESDANIRYIQPLLRGAGPEVAQADLRRARLREIDTILNEQIRRRDVIFDVVNAYFQLLQTARQLQVSADAIRIREQFLEDTRVKFEVGRVSESEILRAEIQFLSEQETAVGRIRQLDDQRDNILILLGLPLDTEISFIDITQDLAQLPRVTLPRTEDAIEESLASRMELMRQDLTIAIAEIDQRVAKNGLLPQLDFDAGYGRSDQDNTYVHSLGMEDSGWDAGLSLRMPLVNIQRRETVRRANISLEQRRTDRLSQERRLTQQVLSNHRSILATEGQLNLLRKNVDAARKNLELINGQYEVGFQTVTEVRLAQDDLFNAETRYSNALLNYQIQLARLYVALGRPLF